MHSTRHAALIGAIVVAALATIHLSDNFAMGKAGAEEARIERTSQPENGVRIGTVDLYLIAERIMLQPALLGPRQEMETRFQARLSEIEDQLREMEARLQVLPQNDPEVQRILEQAQTLQTDYQEILQERQVELEAINSRQLIEAFAHTRRAAGRIADERGYTHILVNRGFDRPIETETVGATLQEMLARPLLVGIEEDDLTDAILESLDLEEPVGNEEGAGIIIPQDLGPDR